MNWTEYQTAAQRTAPTHLSEADRRENAAMMIVGEFGELLDILKKHRFQGHPLDRDELRGEFGDVLWGLAEAATIMGMGLAVYLHTPSSMDTPIKVSVQVANLAAMLEDDCATKGDLMVCATSMVRLMAAHGFTLDEVLEHNVAKLRKRYPQGFSVAASINRGAT